MSPYSHLRTIKGCEIKSEKESVSSQHFRLLFSLVPCYIILHLLHYVAIINVAIINAAIINEITLLVARFL